jgi:hypothetical protein
VGREPPNSKSNSRISKGKSFSHGERREHREKEKVRKAEDKEFLVRYSRRCSGCGEKHALGKTQENRAHNGNGKDL